MRSTKARRCSFAIRAGAAERDSAAAGAASVIGFPLRSGVRGLLAAPSRFGRKRSAVKARGEPSTGSMLVPRRPECGALIRARFTLVFRLPLVVRHAVDELPALVLGHGNALGVGRLLHPVREAVAAEAGKVHQVDVLHLGTRSQMLDEAPEYGGFEVGARRIVGLHDQVLLASGNRGFR